MDEKLKSENMSKKSIFQYFSLDLNEATDDGVPGCNWRQLDHMQTICTSLQTRQPFQHPISQFLQARRSS